MLFFFEVNHHKEWEQKWIRPKNDKYDLAFVRWDRIKWFEMSFHNSKNEIAFSLYPWNNDVLTASMTMKFRDPAHFATYYELEAQPYLSRSHLQRYKLWVF